MFRVNITFDMSDGLVAQAPGFRRKKCLYLLPPLSPM